VSFAVHVMRDGVVWLVSFDAALTDAVEIADGFGVAVEVAA
jgi:hypothetical protein